MNRLESEGIVREITGQARNRIHQAEAVFAAIEEPLDAAADDGSGMGGNIFALKEILGHSTLGTMQQHAYLAQVNTGRAHPANPFKEAHRQALPLAPRCAQRSADGLRSGQTSPVYNWDLKV